MFIMKRGTHTNRGGNPKKNVAQLCPFFDIETAAERWHPHAALLLKVAVGLTVFI